MAIALPAVLEKEIREAAERQGIDAAEFVEAAIQSALSEYRERQIAAESRAWYALPADERRKYEGRYIAIYRGQVVDTDPDERVLHQRIRQKYNRVPVMIARGGDHPMPIYTLRSPRYAGVNDAH